MASINKKKITIIISCLTITVASTVGYDIYKNKKFAQKTGEAANVINVADFIIGLNKVPQLEYAVGDDLVNIKTDDDFYKTFEQNKKFEIFIDKKSEKINSLHYTSSTDDITEIDIEYLRNIYNLSFSNISNYLLDKTIEVMDMMCTSEYINNKATIISKNNIISESISIGKTSEIKINVIYTNNNGKNKPVKVDIAILKGNKW